MLENRELFENTPPYKAILQSAIPSIIGMVVTLIYNIADTYFIGQTGNPLQVAAVSLTMPVFLLFMAMGNLLGIGGTSVISRALGAQKPEYAKKVSSFIFYTSIALGIVFTLLFWGLMPFILQMIGSSSETIGFARDYLTIIAPSAPFVIFSISFSNIVRAEGKSKEAMVGVMIGTIVNIILDPIMILYMDLGVAGAAYATLIGNVVGCVYYILYLLKNNTVLSIAPKYFTAKDHVLSGVLAIGVPAALNNILMSAANIIMNNYLSGYGDIPIAAMGVATKVAMIVVLLQIGLGIGIQPLLGYSFGAKNRKRFSEIMKFASIYTIILGTVLTLICWFGADAIVRGFIDDNSVLELGVTIVRKILLVGPFIGLLFVFINALQAIGAAKESLVITISRQGFVFLPALIILNYFFQLEGIVFAQPVADLFSVVIAFIIYKYRTAHIWEKNK